MCIRDRIITTHGLINLDFNDVRTILKDGGVAIMSTGYGEGEGRVTNAIQDALHSPLLNNNDIYKSQRILIQINFHADEGGNAGVTMDEMNEINAFMEKFSERFELKWGVATDPELDKKVKVTILATGFGIRDVDSEDMKDRIQRYDEKDCLLYTSDAADDCSIV